MVFRLKCPRWSRARQNACANCPSPPIIAKICRDGTKNWFYAFMYGAGDLKLGNMLVFLQTPEGIRFIKPPKDGWTEKSIKALGKKKKEQFLENTPALKALIENPLAMVA